MITLSYPYISPTTTITLPNPLFENSEVLNQKRIVRRTRGLVSKVFRDSIWSEYTTLYYICQACSLTQRDDYLTFVSTAFGKEVKLIDYEVRTWKGILIPAEITEQHRSCGYVIQFEFQGAIQ
jgi:hypothetical protein